MSPVSEEQTVGLLFSFLVAFEANQGVALNGSKKLRYAVNQVRPLQLVVMLQERKTTFIIMLGRPLISEINSPFCCRCLGQHQSKNIADRRTMLYRVART